MKTGELMGVRINASYMSLVNKMVKIILGTVFGSVLFFVIAIHPNDARLHIEETRAVPPKRVDVERLGSLWTHNLEVSFDGMAEDSSSDLQEIAAKWPSTAFIGLQRFKYNNQIYVTYGNYPEHLEGRDALYLSNNATLNLKLKDSKGQRVEFGFGGTHDGDKIEVSLGDKVLDRYEFKQLGLVSKKLKQWITPWLWPDNLLKTERWVDVSLWVDGGGNLQNEKVLKMTCRSRGTGCFVSGLSLYQESTARKIQVIVILIDTLRFDGIDSKRAPYLDLLKKDSLQYVNAVSPGNMTSPSTNALLSCRPPTFLGSWAFSYGVSPEQRLAFARNGLKSFPSQIASMGMKTAMIGNISVVSEVMGVGQNHGFEQQQSIEFDGYDTPIIAHEAQKWTLKNEDKSFLLYVHFNAPHAPNRPPIRDLYNVWPAQNPFWSYPAMLDTLYDAEISYTDRYINKMISLLKERQLYDKVTLVVTADHGDQMKPRPFTGNQMGTGFYGSYHDHGATLLNDEVRVPLFIKKGLASPSTPKIIDDWVSTLQIGPTLIDLGENHIHGECSLPSLPLENGGNNISPVLPIEGFRERAIIFGNRWKYIRSYSPTSKKVYKLGSFSGNMKNFYRKERLFDLKDDPEELRDLSERSPSVLTSAQETYRKTFNLKTGFELVVETSKSEEVSVSLSQDASYKDSLPALEMGQEMVLKFKEGLDHRFKVRLNELGSKLPVINVGGKDLKLTYTRDRLPLSITKPDETKALPFEDNGSDTLFPQSPQTNAYLRKLWDIDREELAIQASNPMFEKMLREWGYLNDN